VLSRKVFVQLPYKPEERRQVGWLEIGSRPDAINWSCWGILPDSVIEAKWRRHLRHRRRLNANATGAADLRGSARLRRACLAWPCACSEAGVYQGSPGPAGAPTSKARQ
jgi:hypothetical protein